MGTVTSGNIVAGALESRAAPSSNTYVSHANSTVTIESSTEYAAGGQEIETYNLTTLNPAEAFVYEKRGVGKKQGYPGFCLVSDQSDGSAVFVDRGPNRHRITRSGDTHHDSGGGVFLHNDTSIYFDGTDYLTVQNEDGSMQMGSQSCTWDWWMYPTSNSAEKFLLGGNGETQGFFHLSIRYDHSPQGWDVRYDTGSARATRNHKDETLTGIPTVNTWNHIAWVFEDGLRYRMYLNGKLQFSQDQAYNFGHEDIHIGVIEGYLTSSARYDGYLDDFRVRKGFTYTKDFIPSSSSPKGTEAIGDIADYTKITMVGYREDSDSYFTAINYVAGDEIIARDYMGIPYSQLQAVAYGGGTQKIIIYNNSTDALSFTTYVESTT